MYITTFYSYKGGVGRSMALVNIAMSLAFDGKRVLMVDFDLEAPGISTYDCLGCEKGHPGIIDYVTEFIQTDIAPDVSDFIVKCGDNRFPIWLMPAGDNEAVNYSSKLNAIDWQRVYEEHSGFLMIEDLKAQWSQFDGQGFDYVFVDSRTGHTDVGGICTRQIPDSIVFMFFPNEQNIGGLEPIVNSVRNYESSNSGAKTLHFCPSNVPDLDDDESILKNILESAKRRLGYDQPSQIIHHYASLDLLQQTVFTTQRPNTRLAEQYLALKSKIASYNYEDRTGSLSALEDIDDKLSKLLRSGNQKALEKILDRTTKIKFHHPDDAEINWNLAQIYTKIRAREPEINSLSVTISRNYKRDESLLQRSSAYMGLNEVEKAKEDLIKVVRSDRVAPFVFVSALQMLSTIDESWPQSIEDARSFRRFDGFPIHLICQILMEKKEMLSLAIQIAEDCISDGRANGHEATLENDISISLIGLGEYEKAVKFLEPKVQAEKLDTAHAFNLAIAKWARDGEAPRMAFQNIIDIHEADKDYPRDANYLQCVAMSYSVNGDHETALDYLTQARDHLPIHGRIFSPWQYLEVSMSQAREEIIEMMELAHRSEILRPTFMASPELFH